MRNRPIGIFDSGIGGLTVVKEILKILPKEDIIYFGDTARVPYGTKSKETIVRFSIENMEFLTKFWIKMAVVACNTSSSLALQVLQKRYELPIIGVIEPGVDAALRVSKNCKIGVIGTKATINSEAYQREIKRRNPKAKIYGKSCPLFVSLVEEGWLGNKVTFDVAKIYLGPLKNKIDTMVLGCTHYPLLKGVISGVLGCEVRLVDSAKATAERIKTILEESDLFSRRKSKGRLKFYVSDEPERFARVGQQFLGQTIKDVRRAR